MVFFPRSGFSDAKTRPGATNCGDFVRNVVSADRNGGSVIRTRGFERLIAVGPGAEAAPDRADLVAAPADIANADSRAAVINKLIAHAAGRWMLTCFNGEFLFYPYHESRRIQDFTEFLSWERRPAAMGYAVDIYSDALRREEDAFSLQDVYFDTEGWYGFERGEQQAEVFGGLGWRFEEFTPRDMTRVNRPALFWADPAVRIRSDPLV